MRVDLVVTLRSDVVPDRDVDELNDEADRTHHKKAGTHGTQDTEVLLRVRLRAFIEELHAFLDESFRRVQRCLRGLASSGHGVKFSSR